MREGEKKRGRCWGLPGFRCTTQFPVNGNKAGRRLPWEKQNRREIIKSPKDEFIIISIACLRNPPVIPSHFEINCR